MRSETNERPASLYTRLLAHNIDLLPVLLIWYSLSFISSTTQYDLWIMIATYLVYHTISEGLNSGQTLGKKLTLTHVQSLRSGVPSVLQIILRNVLKPITVLFFPIWLLASLYKKQPLLHDFLAKTQVLHAK